MPERGEDSDIDIDEMFGENDDLDPDFILAFSDDDEDKIVDPSSSAQKKQENF